MSKSSYNIFRGVSLSLFTITFVLCAMAARHGRLAAEQDPCPDIPDGGNLASIDEYAVSESTCELPSGVATDTDLKSGGAFVKHAKYVLMDSHAQSSGTCQVRLWSGSGCVNGTLQMRNLVKIVMAHQIPSGLAASSHHFPVKPDGTGDTRYDVDTRVANSTVAGTRRELLSGVGAHILRYQSVINTTSCNIQPANSELRAITVNVVKCKPMWWIIGVSPPRTVHLPQQPISVYVPPTMPQLEGPTDQAIADWNAAMAGTGMSMTRVSVPCGLGGDCVNVQEGTVSSGCARTDPGAPNASGETTTPSTITFPPGWSSRPADRNRRSMAHELGHLLGLGEGTCTAADSVMGPAPSCTSTTGMTLSPTPNDTLPTTSSTYGNGNQKACGFQS